MSIYTPLVERLLADLVQANHAAEAANVKVKVARADIRKMYVNKRDEHLREKMRVDYVLNDALEDYRKHCGEVARISNVIQGIAAAASFLDR